MSMQGVKWKLGAILSADVQWFVKMKELTPLSQRTPLYRACMLGSICLDLKDGALKNQNETRGS